FSLWLLLALAPPGIYTLSLHDALPIWVIFMLVALVIATAAGLAPPYLAGLAIDNGIRPHDLGALDLIVGAFIVSALLYWAASYADRKSTRLNSSHVSISYAVFCLKKKR